MARRRAAIRTRNIKPGFWDNEDLADLPATHRLLFAGLWCVADRSGRLEDRPKWIKRKLNLDDLADPEAAIQQLAELGFITRYSADNYKLIQINKFADHQSVHPREPDSELPGFSTDNPGLSADNRESPPNPALGPSGPSGPSGVRDVDDARASVVPFDSAVPRTGLEVGLPPEAANVPCVADATQKQLEEIARLAEVTEIPAVDMLAQTIHKTWTKRSASVVIERYADVLYERRTPKTFLEQKLDKADEAYARVMERNRRAGNE